MRVLILTLVLLTVGCRTDTPDILRPGSPQAARALERVERRAAAGDRDAAVEAIALRAIAERDTVGRHAALVALAAAGNAAAARSLASLAMTVGGPHRDEAAARRWLRRAAELGDAEARAQLGTHAALAGG